MKWVVATGIVLLAAACGQGPDRRRGQRAIDTVFAHGFHAPIVDKAGKQIGTLTGRNSDQGIVVRIEVGSLSPGRHAMHLHEAGRCGSPDFASSGAHWNASGHQHGTDNPRGPHDGDWDNLDIGADGHGSTERLIPRWHGKIPDSGLAFVIHANRDDEITEPDGNSGARVGCGVVIPPT